MNEETIDYRLTQIEQKLSTITELLLQTQAQELRLSTVEKGLSDFIKEYRNTKQKNTDRWLTPLIATVVSVTISALITMILVKVGLK